jgi:hypothetical protein|nr:hypothetical protein Q903MT_gene220 [Picea sitchensis]
MKYEESLQEWLAELMVLEEDKFMAAFHQDVENAQQK